MLARSALFLGNDSGLMHLAAATATPTIGLFGPSRVEEYAPVGPRAAHVVAPGSPAPGFDAGAGGRAGAGHRRATAGRDGAGMTRLSTLVVARNEEARLPACLAALAFADEIVVVLDRSTDGSAAIARAAGATRDRGRLGAGGRAPQHRHRRLHRRLDPGSRCRRDRRARPGRGVRAIIATSRHAWHLVPVDNYIGDRLVRHGWAGSFGTSAVPRLFRRGAKRWREQRVHPGLDWTGDEGPRLTARRAGALCRPRHLRHAAAAGSLFHRQGGGPVGERQGRHRCASNVRRFFSRGFKSYVSRKGYREGGWGVLLALCTGRFPLLAYLKATLEPERHRPPPEAPR